MHRGSLRTAGDEHIPIEDRPDGGEPIEDEESRLDDYVMPRRRPTRDSETPG